MKQDIATYLVDSFIDYKGRERKIVACALSQTPHDDNWKMRIGWVNHFNTILPQADIYEEVYKMVSIGIAICNPSDPFDEEVGKKIARSKAENAEGLPRIYTPCKGIITKELVDTFLNQQVQFFKENPETLIRGYNEAKEAYEAAEKAKAEIDNLTPEEKAAFDLAVKGIDLSKYTDLAKKYVNKFLHG